MTDTSPGRVDEMRKRLSDATDGPWGLNYGGALIVAGPDVIGQVFVYEDDGDPPTVKARANASLIAHAPADISWLLSEREALELADIEHRTMNDVLSDALQSSRDEVSALRKALGAT